MSPQIKEILVSKMTVGSKWFRRFYKDCKKMSPYLRFVRIQCGFYRIYYKFSYVHEVYQEMPAMGYDMDDLDPRFENQKYFEEFEEEGVKTRKLKNYVEGYWDSIDRVRTRLYMLRNDKEFNERAQGAYNQFIVK